MTKLQRSYRPLGLTEDQIAALPNVRIKIPSEPNERAGISGCPLHARLHCSSIHCSAVFGYVHRTYVPPIIPAGLRGVISPTCWHGAEYDGYWFDRAPGFAAVMPDSSHRFYSADVIIQPERVRRRVAQGKLPALRRVQSSSRKGWGPPPRERFNLTGLIIPCPRCKNPQVVNRVTMEVVDRGLEACILALPYDVRIERRNEDDVCLYRAKGDPDGPWQVGHVERMAWIDSLSDRHNGPPLDDEDDPEVL